MAGERGWSGLSFTPTGKKSCPFNDAGVVFPGCHAGEDGAEIDLGSITGPIDIRIQSSNIGVIPRFEIGEAGIFQGTDVKAGIRWCAQNARVVESKPGDLRLEAETLDGVTSPVGTHKIRHGGGQHSGCERLLRGEK